MLPPHLPQARRHTAGGGGSNGGFQKAPLFQNNESICIDMLTLLEIRG